MSEEEITEPVETANSDDGVDSSPEDTFQEPWMENLPDELQDDSSLGKFKDVASLAKGYKHMESFRGQSISIPEEQTPESMNEPHFARAHSMCTRAHGMMHQLRGHIESSGGSV